jgi:tetratricopeptide (TPR) repeat protein
MFARSKKLFFYSLVLVTFIEFSLTIVFQTKVWAQNVYGVISKMGDTTHIEFRGRKDWNYQASRSSQDKLILTMPPLDEKTVLQLKSWNCSLIRQVDVNTSGTDGKYEVTFVFADANTDSFDYLTDDPSYLIIDFFKKITPEDSKAQVAANVTPTERVQKSESKRARKSKKIAKLPAKKTLNDDDYRLKERNPASDEILQVENAGPGRSRRPPTQPDRMANILFERGVFDAGDPNYDRFRVNDYEVNELAIISSQKNIYLKFPILSQQLNGFDEMMKLPPEYEIAADETAENKEARFIIMLFQKKRWGALFETLKYFYKKYPKTKYEEIVKNIEAEAHIQIYSRDNDPKDYEKFVSLYEYLIETFPDSLLAERNMLLVGYASLKNRDGAKTLQVFQKYQEKYPKSEYMDRIRIAIAEAYVFLHKPEDALRYYSDLAQNANDSKYAVEALYRIGDVYFWQEDYQKSIAAYEAARKKYPTYVNFYPNAAYNIAESQFWLKSYRASLDSYINFLKVYPTHKHGGFAMSRVGEVLEILGAAPEKIMGAYTEGYFRFPDSQGSEVSRIRMLSQALKNMKDREKRYAVEEIDAITKKSTLPRIEEFATLMKADGFARRVEYNDSLNLLVDYYQKNPTTANLAVFKSRILRNIADILKVKSDGRQYIDTLNFYGKFINTWLKNSDRIDTLYFQALAYEKSGVVAEAETSYKKILEKLTEISGGQEEKERRVYEHLPTISQINLRIAATALEQKRYQDSFKHIQKIKSKMSLPEEIEKIRIGAKVSEEMGNTKDAISFLEKLIESEKQNEVQLLHARLDLARLYMKNKNYDAADKHLSSVEATRIRLGAGSGDDTLKELELRGDIQYHTGQRLAAVETYLKLLDQFEAKLPLSSIRYRAGLILFEDGDLKGAQKIWDSLGEKSGLVYKKLALEKLSQAEWMDNYKKYIDRIPAAEQMR